jgi:riboflavin kinase
MLILQYWSLLGPVCKGYGRGSKQLGFPTANLPQFDKELSKHGVNRGIYFGWCNIGSDKQTYPCVANIGISPTFVGQVRTHCADDAHQRLITHLHTNLRLVRL